MRNILSSLQDMYLPKKALLFYEHQQESRFYVEAYDMDTNGTAINARPLNMSEADDIAKALQVGAQHHSFLHLTGLLPTNVIYLDASRTGCVVWHTQPRKVPLFFKKELAIPCGKAWVPGLLWKADKKDLYLYALGDKKRPTYKTPLFHAPFFNVHADGSVCMGTVDTEIPDNISLEGFMKRWEQFFFNSYFSHVIGGSAPVEGNIIQLWQHQTTTNRRFPESCLKKHPLTLKKLLPCQ